MNLVPGLSLRVSPGEEEVGCDDCQLGEFAYDYVELTRHVSDSVRATSSGNTSIQGVTRETFTNVTEKTAPREIV